MFDKSILSESKEENYKMLLAQYPYVLTSSDDIIANLANTAAILNFYLKDINWVGFYLTKGDKLILGPFQGFLACTEIKFGKGVCGVCAESREIQLVPNVDEFPGHIACDSITKSEVVLPIIVHEKVYGVLDIDSPLLNNFDEIDSKYLSLLVEHLVDFLSKKTT